MFFFSEVAVIGTTRQSQKLVYLFLFHSWLHKWMLATLPFLATSIIDTSR